MENNYCFCKTYSEIKSTWPVKSSNEETDSSRESRELFEQRFVKGFDQNRKHMGGTKSKNRHPSWLYCAMEGLSETATGGVV